MKSKKIGVILLIWLMLVAGLAGCVDTEKILADTKIKDVDLTQVADGTYQGQHSASEVKVLVEVKVKKSKIKTIEILKHDNWRGSKAEVIIKDVLKKQSVDLDIVSGATVSSKVILKAIENALRQGIS